MKAFFANLIVTATTLVNVLADGIPETITFQDLNRNCNAKDTSCTLYFVLDEHYEADSRYPIVISTSGVSAHEKRGQGSGGRWIVKQSYDGNGGTPLIHLHLILNETGSDGSPPGQVLGEVIYLDSSLSNGVIVDDRSLAVQI